MQSVSTSWVTGKPQPTLAGIQADASGCHKVETSGLAVSLARPRMRWAVVSSRRRVLEIPQRPAGRGATLAATATAETRTGASNGSGRGSGGRSFSSKTLTTGESSRIPVAPGWRPHAPLRVSTGLVPSPSTELQASARWNEPDESSSPHGRVGVVNSSASDGTVEMPKRSSVPQPLPTAASAVAANQRTRQPPCTVMSKTSSRPPQAFGEPNREYDTDSS